MTEKELKEKLFEIFFPQVMERVAGCSQKLVHYTSASAAMNILESKQLWMRNVTCMNDYQEINYGVSLLRRVLGSVKAELIVEALGERGKIWKEISNAFAYKGAVLKYRTYITCFSEHEEKEDELGRLSMWRGYGSHDGVAIVVKSDIFKSEFDKVDVSSSPVEYWKASDLEKHFEIIAENIKREREFIDSLTDSVLAGIFQRMFAYGLISIKHPGFWEEREWRVISVESDESRCSRLAGEYGMRGGLVETIQCINGIPQIIKLIPLTDKEESDEAGFSINEILDRIIIGPTPYFAVLRNAFVRKLIELGVNDAERKVIVSEIPYRC